MKYSPTCPGSSKSKFKRNILVPITGALALSFVFSSSANAAIDLASITRTSDFDSAGEYFLSSDIENISSIEDDDIDNTYSIFSSFSGTLNGNGFSISELNKPLFGNLDQAAVSNLILNTVEEGSY